MIKLIAIQQTSGYFCKNKINGINGGIPFCSNEQTVVLKIYCFLLRAVPPNEVKKASAHTTTANYTASTAVATQKQK